MIKDKDYPINPEDWRRKLWKARMALVTLSGMTF